MGHVCAYSCTCMCASNSVSHSFLAGRLTNPPIKIGSHFEFSNFGQKWQNKIASISLTVRDRAISSKFSIPRASKQYALLTLGKLLEENILEKKNKFFRSIAIS